MTPFPNILFYKSWWHVLFCWRLINKMKGNFNFLIYILSSI